MSGLNSLINKASQFFSSFKRFSHKSTEITTFTAWPLWFDLTCSDHGLSLSW